MKIEERLKKDFNCPLKHKTVSEDGMLNTGFRYIVNNNLILKLPNVTDVNLKSLIGVRQLSGTSKLIDIYSQFKDAPYCNNEYIVESGRDITLQLQMFSGRKQWVVVSKQPIHLNMPQSDMSIRQLKTTVKGDPGPKGDKGDPGKKGSMGVRGPRGKRGLEGKRGPRGFRGIQGSPGVGKIGPRGKKGDKGEPGVNSRVIDRFYFPGEITLSSDMHHDLYNMTYRYYGPNRKIKRVIFIIGENYAEYRPIFDILINKRLSLFDAPLKLPECCDESIELNCKDIELHDGDTLSFPCILYEETLYDLEVVIEYELY